METFSDSITDCNAMMEMGQEAFAEKVGLNSSDHRLQMQAALRVCAAHFHLPRTALDVNITRLITRLELSMFLPLRADLTDNYDELLTNYNGFIRALWQLLKDIQQIPEEAVFFNIEDLSGAPEDLEKTIIESLTSICLIQQSTITICRESNTRLDINLPSPLPTLTIFIQSNGKVRHNLAAIILSYNQLLLGR